MVSIIENIWQYTESRKITKNLGVEPTSQHRKGEKKGLQSPPFKDDMWCYKVPIPEDETLHKHIDMLWSKIKPNNDYLLSLKHTLKVDIFLGYRSNHDFAGIEVPHTSLEMFQELEVPFGLSIVIA